MRSYPAPAISEEVIANLQILVAAGAGAEELIAKMREAGLSIIPSIRLVSRFLDLSTRDAKRLVHFSSTWSDCRDRNEALHDAAEAALLELNADSLETPRSMQVR